MKFKQYIVTYNNPTILNERALRSIFDSLSAEELNKVEINIINNHSNFKIYDEFKDKPIKVLHNVLRPDFSTGHLARNWNQGIINGFKSLSNPDCDAVILMQHDCIVAKNYINKLETIHNKGISFIVQGHGDEFMSMTPASVKRVGLFDERFCNIGHQETDYFIRQLIFNSKNVNINDMGNWIYNQTDIELIKNVTTGCARRDPAHLASLPYHRYSEAFIAYKYKMDTWNAETVIEKGIQVMNNVPYLFMYPYFEKDIETLQQQHCIYHNAT